MQEEKANSVVVMKFGLLVARSETTFVDVVSVSFTHYAQLEFWAALLIKLGFQSKLASWVFAQLM